MRYPQIRNAEVARRKRSVKSRGLWKIVNQCDPSGLDYSPAIALIVGSESQNRLANFFYAVITRVIRLFASYKYPSFCLSMRHAKSFIVLFARCSFNCVIVYNLLSNKKKKKNGTQCKFRHSGYFNLDVYVHPVTGSKTRKDDDFTLKKYVKNVEIKFFYTTEFVRGKMYFKNRKNNNAYFVLFFINIFFL